MELNSSKRKRLYKLVELSYDLSIKGIGADSIFWGRAIEQEKAPALKRDL